MIGYAFARFKIKTITVFTTGDGISLGSSGGFCLLPHPAGNGGGLDPRLFEWNSAKRCRGGYSVETCGQSGETDKKSRELTFCINSVIFSLFQLHLSILCSGQICYQQFWCARYNCIPSAKRLKQTQKLPRICGHNSAAFGHKGIGSFWVGGTKRFCWSMNCFLDWLKTRRSCKKRSWILQWDLRLMVILMHLKVLFMWTSWWMLCCKLGRWWNLLHLSGFVHMCIHS